MSASIDVWEWRPGMSWRRVLELPEPETPEELETAGRLARRAIALRPAGTTRAAIAAELEFDPNHADAAELLELADAIGGPVPDLLRRRHTR